MWRLEKIPLTELEESLTYIEIQSAPYDRWIVLSEFGSRATHQQMLYLKCLSQKITQLRDLNQTDLFSPYIGPDLERR